MNTYNRQRFPHLGGSPNHQLWRAVDQDGEVVDVYLQAKRDGAAAKRFFCRLLHSYGVAHRELMPDVIHDDSQYANNRAGR
jgi:putative transposase